MEESKKGRVLVLSHNDLDGVSAGLVVYKAYKGKADVDWKFLRADELDKTVTEMLDNNEMDSYDDVVITDISFKTEEAAKRFNDYKEDRENLNVCLLDHHKTALWLNQYKWCHVKVEDEGILCCGTQLTYEWFKGEIEDDMQEYVEDVRQYDTWDWTKTNNQRAYQMNILSGIYGAEVYFKNYKDKSLSNYSFTETEKLMIEDKLRREKESIKEYLHKLPRITIQGLRAALLVGVPNTYTVAHEACKKLGVDCAISVNLNNSSISVCTSRSDVDLTKLRIIQNYGGGHAKACGARLNFEDLRSKYVEQLIERGQHSWWFNGVPYSSLEEKLRAVGEYCREKKCPFYYGEGELCMVGEESSQNIDIDEMRCEPSMFYPEGMIGYCKECCTEIYKVNAIDNEREVYECPHCGYPNAKGDLWDVPVDYTYIKKPAEENKKVGSKKTCNCTGCCEEGCHCK